MISSESIADEIERVTEANMRLQQALAFEAHNAISHFDAELSFWLRSAATRLARQALVSGCHDLARELIEFVESGAPREHRDKIIRLLLNV